MVLAALLIIVVKVIRRKRAEGESSGKTPLNQMLQLNWIFFVEAKVNSLFVFSENNTRMEDDVVSIISCTDVLRMLHRWFKCTLTASVFSEL